MWRVAIGRTQRPLKLVAPPEVYREAFDFEHVVETTAPLLFLLRRFVDQLSSRLQVRYVVASQMTLRLPLDDGETYERVFSIPEPTSEADVMFRTLETHLDQLTLPQQPVGLSLEIEAMEPTRQQFGLFGTRLRDPNRFGHTLARIGAWSGCGRWGSLCLRIRTSPTAISSRPGVAWNAEEPGEPNREWLGLPLQRCRPAIAATVETRHSCPVRISSSLADGRITEALGPYRLSGHWWDPAAWQQEEWDIALGDGLYRIARRITNGGWRAAMSGYVELHARSALSFLRGASRPEELSKQAAELTLPAMALCDRDGLLRRSAASCCGQRYRHRAPYRSGADHGGWLHPACARGHAGRVSQPEPPHYGGEAARLENRMRRALGRIACLCRRLLALTGESDGILQHRAGKASEDRLEKVLAAFGRGNVYVEVQRHLLRGEERRQQYLEAVAARRHLPIVATNGVMYHDPARRGVQDVFTCIRHHTSLCKAGRLLSANGERFLKGPEQMRRLFADHPEYLDNTLRVAERLEFRLADLGYEFPKYPVPDGESMEAFLRRTTMEGARRLYGSGLSEKVRRQLEFELDLICRLGFAGYFLIVWDLVNYCRKHDILVQGRGARPTAPSATAWASRCAIRWGRIFFLSAS